MKSMEAIGVQERKELRDAWDEERKKVMEVESESKILVSELVQQHKASQAENNTLKSNIQELEKQLAAPRVVESASTGTNVSVALQARLEEPEKLVEERDQQNSLLEIAGL